MDKSQRLAAHAPLFARAEREGLWFYGRYHDIWFSPAELRDMHTQGRFIWGTDNWELLPPAHGLARLQGKVEDAQVAVDDFAARMRKPCEGCDSDDYHIHTCGRTPGR